MSSKSSRRAFISATVASFAWLITGGRAAATTPAISAGAPCKVKGKERTVDGVTFVCRNAKGKLVWRRKPGEATTKVITVRVLESAELELGKTKVVNAPAPNGGTTGVVLTRTSAGITALRVNCTHQGFPVGRVGAVLECELHGSRFNPETGAVINGPAARPLTRYDASETNGGIYVTVTSA
ncbi:MAG: Rieske (2Fe-2S) protein [Actinobacteria bacterium]|jgi:nitrite reductase/ring-hydroxylating ferredoxin subunit|nr:Rieske (2Fe-2S) protein [Actinomycetota bacterium]